MASPIADPRHPTHALRDNSTTRTGATNSSKSAFQQQDQARHIKCGGGNSSGNNRNPSSQRLVSPAAVNKYKPAIDATPAGVVEARRESPQPIRTPSQGTPSQSRSAGHRRQVTMTPGAGGGGNAGDSRSSQSNPRAHPGAAAAPTSGSRRGSSTGVGRGQGSTQARRILVSGMSQSERARLEARDSGEKAACPACHRGMDHWQPGRRQEVSVTCDMVLITV